MSKINSLKEYKNSLLKRKIITISIQLAVILSFILLWEFLVYKEILNEFLLSKPSAIYSLFIKYMQEGNLMYHIGVSCHETIMGLIIGTLLGFIIAVILYLFPLLAKVFDPYLIVLNALPKTALAPILIIWVGTNSKGIITVAISLSIVITIINSYNFFKSVDESLIKMMKTFHASKFQILTKIIFPANYVNLISIIKVNIGLSWVGVIVGEFLVSRAGIGNLLVYGSQVFKLDLVMMGVIVLAIIAFIMYEAINILEIFIRKKRNH